jgi:hypothetical protein
MTAPTVLVDRPEDLAAAQRYGVALATLLDWRSGWPGDADDFCWDDPDVDAQIRWLVGAAEGHGVALATLLDWRFGGWLGEGDPYDPAWNWKDPEVVAQIRWLALIEQCGGAGADSYDAAAGPVLRASGCVYAYRVFGSTEWVPIVGEDGLERHVARLGEFQLVATAAVRPVRDQATVECDLAATPGGLRPRSRLA